MRSGDSTSACAEAQFGTSEDPIATQSELPLAAALRGGRFEGTVVLSPLSGSVHDLLSDFPREPQSRTQENATNASI